MREVTEHLCRRALECEERALSQREDGQIYESQAQDRYRAAERQDQQARDFWSAAETLEPGAREAFLSKRSEERAALGVFGVALQGSTVQQ